MSELYNGFRPELKFFGTMNGNSSSHTNAFFCPDEETIVFIDLSALNMAKADLVLTAMPNLKHFYACVTHTHFDHASGFGRIAFTVKTQHAGELLTVIADRTVSDEVVALFDSSGMRSLNASMADEDKVYELLSYDMYGRAYTFYDRHGKILPKTVKPHWFVRTLPTKHSQRVNTSGFVFFSHGKLVVYSGDTNDLTPYISFLRLTVEEELWGAEPPIEFYLDVATRKSEPHLNFLEIAEELEEALKDYPTMTLILMHYDDKKALHEQAKARLSEFYGKRLFIAEEAAYLP
ncbi:hypothetical protein IIZ77_03125 [Candidatus Saccharibacteria bacterium]|nr:hypothetical protein [Candidatus Saccharibacteria bacterium]